MKVIFLDVDGVLNRISVFGEHKIFVDEKCVRALNRIVSETAAMIVISSAWRIIYGDDAAWMLKTSGVRAEFIGKTPSISLAGRGDEIQSWLDNEGKVFNVDGYVIIDDEDFMFSQKFKERLVLTNKKVGLTEDDADKAVKILNNIGA